VDQVRAATDQRQGAHEFSASVSEEYLLGEQDIALDGVEFRKKADMSAKDEAQVEARVLQLLERYLTIEEILGPPCGMG
jgi:hypothetical protein